MHHKLYIVETIACITAIFERIEKNNNFSIKSLVISFTPTIQMFFTNRKDVNFFKFTYGMEPSFSPLKVIKQVLEDIK